jgi:hypothetical protein
VGERAFHGGANNRVLKKTDAGAKVVELRSGRHQRCNVLQLEHAFGRHIVTEQVRALDQIVPVRRELANFGVRRCKNQRFDEHFVPIPVVSDI